MEENRETLDGRDGKKRGPRALEGRLNVKGGEAQYGIHTGLKAQLDALLEQERTILMITLRLKEWLVEMQKREHIRTRVKFDPIIPNLGFFFGCLCRFQIEMDALYLISSLHVSNSLIIK